MSVKRTIAGLQAMKRQGRQIVGIVAWDFQIARIADGLADLVSVGDTVGVNLWGHSNPLEITLDELLIVVKAVRRGVSTALLSADFPFGPLQSGTADAVAAAIRMAKEGGVDLVKVDGAADFPEAVTAIGRAGIPVIAQFGVTPQTALRYGIEYRSTEDARNAVSAELTEELVEQAVMLEHAGAVMLNFTNSGPVVGAAVAAAVAIPVIGGHGGGPWLDGRIRLAHTAIGYSADGIDGQPPTAYTNVARTVYEALDEYAEDVRAGRQVRGGQR
jgi:3-methyl-2-oxobutanoate hydroxymethyltransferase